MAVTRYPIGSATLSSHRLRAAMAPTLLPTTQLSRMAGIMMPSVYGTASSTTSLTGVGNSHTLIPRSPRNSAAQ